MLSYREAREEMGRGFPLGHQVTGELLSLQHLLASKVLFIHIFIFYNKMNNNKNQQKTLLLHSRRQKIPQLSMTKKVHFNAQN